MNKKTLLPLLLIIVAIGGFMVYNSDTGSSFPSKTLEIIVSWPAGGGTDLAIRSIVEPASKVLGQTINVVNLPGGTGSIGYTEAAKKSTDGYSLVALQFDVLSVSALGLSDVSKEDFEPIMMFASQPMAFAVPASSPWQTLDDLVQGYKAAPGKNFGGATGIGGVNHQALTLAGSLLGIEYNYIPYAGNAEALPELLGNHVEAVVCMLTGLEQSVRSGGIRVLAIMDDKRLEAYPDVPTFKELGYDVEYAGFYGIGVPKGTDPEAKKILEDAFTQAYNDPEFSKVISGMDLLLDFKNSTDFQAFLDMMLPQVQEVLKKIEM